MQAFSEDATSGGALATTHFQPLSVLQNSVLKCILNRSTTELKIEQLYIFRTLMFLYKCWELFKWEEPRQYSITTRSTLQENRLIKIHTWFKTHTRAQAVVGIPKIYNIDMLETRVGENKRIVKKFAEEHKWDRGWPTRMYNRKTYVMSCICIVRVNGIEEQN